MNSTVTRQNNTIRCFQCNHKGHRILQSIGASSPIPDYVMPGVANQSFATILAGILGVLIVLTVATGIAYIRRKRDAEAAKP
ncbi:MAG: PDGLE domain-containing protein [Anaerolineales bacterium]|nr:PDGLE domain-containing protein [Anaerolineales bacterium]